MSGSASLQGLLAHKSQLERELREGCDCDSLPCPTGLRASVRLSRATLRLLGVPYWRQLGASSVLVPPRLTQARRLTD